VAAAVAAAAVAAPRAAGDVPAQALGLVDQLLGPALDDGVLGLLPLLQRGLELLDLALQVRQLLLLLLHVLVELLAEGVVQLFEDVLFLIFLFRLDVLLCEAVGFRGSAGQWEWSVADSAGLADP